MNCAGISVAENHSGLNPLEYAKALAEVTWLVMNVKQMEQSVDQCALCTMIYTKVMNVIPADAHVVYVFKVQDPGRGIQSIWLYHGWEKNQLQYCAVTLMKVPRGMVMWAEDS